MTNHIPNFSLCEATGKYQARRPLTEQQIINAAKRILKKRVSRGSAMTSASVTKNYLITCFSEHPSEAFLCLFLDNQHGLIASEELFSGTIDGAAVYPREVVRRCLELNAAAVIFAHNHPSGILKPSGADRRITARLKEALGTVDIRTLDHVIVAGGDAFSFAERGIL